VTTPPNDLSTELPTELPPVVLSWPAFGDVEPILGQAGVLARYFILSYCGHIPARGYHCITHQTFCRHLGALTDHITPGGVHRLVTYCPKHATFEAASADMIAGWRKAGAQ
jgi:hypothetical protein